MGNGQSAEAPRRSQNKLSKPKTNNFTDGGPVQGTIQRQDSQNQLTIAPTSGSSLDLENAVQEAGSQARDPKGRTRLRDSLLRSMSSDKRKQRRNTVSNFEDIVPLPVEPPPQWSSQSRPNSVMYDSPSFTPSANNTASNSPIVGRSRPSSRSRPTSMIYDQRTMPSSMVFELPGDTSFFEEDYNPHSYDSRNLRNDRSSTSLVHQQQGPRLSLVTEQREKSTPASAMIEWNGQEGRNSPRLTQAHRSASTTSIIPPTRRRSMLTPGMATRQNSYDQRQSMINLPPAGTYNSPDDIKGHYFADFSGAAPAALTPVYNSTDDQSAEEQAYHAGGYKRGSLRITNGNSSPQSTTFQAEEEAKEQARNDAEISAPLSAHPTEYDTASEGNSGDDDKPLTMALVPSSKALVQSRQQRPSSRNSRPGSSRSSPKPHSPAVILDAPPRVGPSTPLNSNPHQPQGIESMDLIDFSENVNISTSTESNHNELALIEMNQKDSPSRSLELARDYQQLTGTMPESVPVSRASTPMVDLNRESVSAPSTRPVSPAYPLRITDGSEVPPSPVSPVLTPSNSSSGSTRSTAGTSRTSGSSGTFGRATEIKPITKIDSPYGSTVSLRSLGRANEIRQKESKRVSWSGDFQELPTVPDREAPPMPKLPQQARGQPAPRKSHPGHRRTASGPIAPMALESAQQIQTYDQQKQQGAMTRPGFYQNDQSDSRSSLPSMSTDFHNPSPPASPSMARKWSKPRPLSQSIVNAQGPRHTGQAHIPPVPEEKSLKLEEQHVRASQQQVMRPNNMGRSESRGTLTTIMSMGTEEMYEEAREDSAREQSIPQRLTSPPMSPQLMRQATAPSRVNSPVTSIRPARVTSPPVSYQGGAPALARQQTAPSRVASAPPVKEVSPPNASLSPPPAPAGPLRRSMTADMTRPMTSSAYIEMPILRNLSFDNPTPKPKARPTSMFVESTFKIAAKKEEAEKEKKEKDEKEKSKKLQKEKPQRPKVSRRRTYHEDELAPMSPAEWEQSIGSYDHLGPGIGFSPFDLASPTMSPSTSYFDTQPANSPKPRGRATGMDAEAASEFARQKSRIRESSRRRSQSHNRLSLDMSRMSGAGGDQSIRTVSSPVYGEDAPPVPELPNKLRSSLAKKKSPPPVSMSSTMRKPVGSGSPRDQNRSAPLPNRNSVNLDDLPAEQVMRPASSYAHGDQPDTWDPKTRSWVPAANAPMSANDQLLQNRARRMSENRRPATARTSSSRPVSMYSTYSTTTNSIYGCSSPAAESYVNLPELQKAEKKAASPTGKAVDNVVIIRSRPNSTRPSLENLRINTGINSGRPSLERLRDSVETSRAHSTRPSLENLRANTYNNSGRTSPVRLHQRSQSEYHLPQAKSRPVSGDFSQARPRPRPQSTYSRSRPVSGNFGSGVNADGGLMIIDRYQGGMQFGYEKGFGLGGSAGTRGPESGASRKSLDESSLYGIDFSDIPMVAY